ncbi:MAG: molybdate ABC transporter permease subunit [Aphanocapsa sp. GSE-SYN-MK-11-07L]|jgi:molybdate transport system permease protein|nr:molybdate ABC transporter permease subunit [Aphanocapsa sp. GSE-SYN-MK-11-07L]
MELDLSPLWISLKVAAIATLATFLIGLATAYRMARYRGRWRSLIDGICISPLILPPTVVGFVLLQLLGKYGPVGQLLHRFKVDIIFTWYAGAIAATVVTFPLMYRTALGAFEQIDGNLLSAARTLGASETRLFWRIALPLALPGILAGTTLAFARGLGEFGATLMLAGNIPGLTTTMPLAIYAAVEAGDIQQAWFWSGLILAVSLAAIALVNLWQFRRQSQAWLPRPKPFFRSESPQKITYSRTGLVVEIEKQLPNFYLQIAFESDHLALGILGASGAGKSMLLKCIVGTETPDRGRIILNGRVLFDSDQGINLPSRERGIGIIFQNYALFPHLTVAENVGFGILKPRQRFQLRRSFNPAIQPQVEAQLRAVGLAEMGDRYPHQLSGGQQQRVALARALISQPEGLLLDEPFSALDTHLQYLIEQQLISILNRYAGVTLFVTHNMEEAYRVCQNLLVLEQGQIIAYGRKQDIFEHPQTVSVARLTGCKNFSRAVATGEQTMTAIDWECNLQTPELIRNAQFQVGVRAHQLKFTQEPNPSSPNTFPCWLANTSETPHRITLYVKLHAPPHHAADYHLQAEVFKEKWLEIKDQPLPWSIHLDPLRLMVLSDLG